MTLQDLMAKLRHLEELHGPNTKISITATHWDEYDEDLVETWKELSTVEVTVRNEQRLRVLE